MLISKKDLLAMTGISYGQLYRWKRSGLIPDEWFIKQSSYTGQETFFPREQILSRIQSIQDLKDKYSLEELARMFSPEVSERTYGEEDLEKVTEISKELLAAFIEAFGKKDFLYTELVLMVILSEAKGEFNISDEQITALVQGMKGTINDLKSTDIMTVLINTGENYYMMLYPEQTQIYLDERLDIIKEIRMDETAARIKLKYQEQLNIM